MPGPIRSLIGTISEFFHLGGITGPMFKVSPSRPVLQTKLGDDSDFTQLEAAQPCEGKDAVNKDFAEGHFPLIVKFQADTSASLPTNIGTKEYTVVTTPGSGAGIGDLLFSDGSGAGPQAIIPAVEGRAIITTDPFTGGAIEFLADKIYIWDADTASWVLGGDAGAAAGADKVISVATALVGVSSAAAIPAGAIITRAAFQASAAYSAGATITTTIGGVEAVLSPADSIPESVSTPLFLVDQLTPTAAGGTVDVAVGGAPAAGAGVVFVWYTEPLT